MGEGAGAGVGDGAGDGVLVRGGAVRVGDAAGGDTTAGMTVGTDVGVSEGVT
jgi:hypothetical protein